LAKTAGEAARAVCAARVGSGAASFAADQDNAIAHAGTAADDPWFAELGKRVADTLDAAGIPYCKGGVMAAKPTWRRNLDGWRAQVAAWIRNPAGENLLSVDIFYDFRRACGDPGLADALRAAAAQDHRRLSAPAGEGANTQVGATMLGRFRMRTGAST
jgi:signal-transduction protein with cAMP-binding, CBS, and nucleotidyltransferase domain